MDFNAVINIGMRLQNNGTKAMLSEPMETLICHIFSDLKCYHMDLMDFNAVINIGMRLQNNGRKAMLSEPLETLIWHIFSDLKSSSMKL